jgi:hypothetical protein
MNGFRHFFQEPSYQEDKEKKELGGGKHIPPISIEVCPKTAGQIISIHYTFSSRNDLLMKFNEFLGLSKEPQASEDDHQH